MVNMSHMRHRLKNAMDYVANKPLYRNLLQLTGRFLTFGISAEGRPLVVAHIEQDDRIRVISSRLMTRRERQAYEST